MCRVPVKVLLCYVNLSSIIKKKKRKKSCAFPYRVDFLVKDNTKNLSEMCANCGQLLASLFFIKMKLGNNLNIQQWDIS